MYTQQLLNIQISSFFNQNFRIFIFIPVQLVMLVSLYFFNRGLILTTFLAITLTLNFVQLILIKCLHQNFLINSPLQFDQMLTKYINVDQTWSTSWSTSSKFDQKIIPDQVCWTNLIKFDELWTNLIKFDQVLIRPDQTFS